ncbi:hypothetical protein FOCC_FOCC016285 [Frankliniella occidentalis]|nr:hypothetical protein FOCC_FOCC016285 [Frankliniella occidentalis]
MGYSITTSSPGYARSNGLAEKAVGVARKMITKCAEEGTHYLDALREYNNTPISGTAFSPAQILMSRMCRTLLPSVPKALAPRVVNVRPQLKRLQEKVKGFHDRRAKHRVSQFKPGDPVVYFNRKQWKKGTIVGRHSAPRSYIIRNLAGRELRRTTFHLKHSNTQADHLDRTSQRHDIDHLLSDPQVPPARQREVPQPRAGSPNREEDDIPGNPDGPGHMDGPGIPEPENPGTAPTSTFPRGGKRTRSGRLVQMPFWKRQDL